MEFFSVVQNPGLLLNMDIFPFIFLFLKTYGILRTGCFTGNAFSTLTPMHAVLIGDHTPNMDRSDLFQVFRTMLTNKLKQLWNYQTEKQNCSLGRKKKRPQIPRLSKQQFHRSTFWHCEFFPWPYSISH